MFYKFTLFERLLTTVIKRNYGRNVYAQVSITGIIISEYLRRYARRVHNPPVICAMQISIPANAHLLILST